MLLDLIERAGRHAEGAVFVDGFFPESTDPVIKPVIEAYRSAYQEEPDILSAQAYDAAMMVLSLIKEHKDTPQAIRDGLLAMKDYPRHLGSDHLPRERRGTEKTLHHQDPGWEIRASLAPALFFLDKAPCFLLVSSPLLRPDSEKKPSHGRTEYHTKDRCHGPAARLRHRAA